MSSIILYSCIYPCAYVAIVQWGLYIILRILLLARGLYIVHETGRRRWFRGCLATSCVVVGDCRLTGGGLLRWQGESGSCLGILEARRVSICHKATLL